MTSIDDSLNADAPRVPLEPLYSRDPRQLGDYRLLGRLGSGGMGVAFLAEAPSGWAVVKLLRPDIADDRRRRRWIARELEAMRLAAGPFTASLLEEHVDEDPSWFAMEFIPGMTLQRHIDESGPLKAPALNEFASRLKTGLIGIHAHGLVHRDLKPSNIILSPSGPRLIDFGIAYVPGATQWTTGVVMGSLGWLAPEQIQGAEPSPATDTYAWALCVIFAATGKPPFGSISGPMEGYKPFLATPEIPAAIHEPLRTEVIRALSTDPALRPDWQRDASTNDASLKETRKLEDPTIILTNTATGQRAWLSGKQIGLLVGLVLGLAALTGTVLLATSFFASSAANDSSRASASPTISPQTRNSSQTPTTSESSSPPPTPTPTPTVSMLPPPEGFKVRARDRSIVVTWAPVAGATGYAVKLNPGSSLSPTYEVDDGTRLVIRDLRNGKQYDVVVAAYSEGGLGDYSATKSVTPKAPGQPQPAPVPTYTGGGGSGGGGNSGGGGEVIIVPDPDPTEIEPVP